jgi:hypothetical protein
MTRKTRHDKKDKKDKGDVSKTITKQKLKHKDVGSDYSDNTNCGQNTIHSLALGICPDASITIDLDSKWFSPMQ